MRLDPKDAASDLAWDTAETLVHRATLLESREDATKLLRSPSLQVSVSFMLHFTEIEIGKLLRKKRRFAYVILLSSNLAFWALEENGCAIPFLARVANLSTPSDYATFADYAIS